MDQAIIFWSESLGFLAHSRYPGNACFIFDLSYRLVRCFRELCLNQESK